MIFVAVVYFIVRRHRRGLSRREGTAANIGCMNSLSGQENALRLADIGPGRRGQHHVGLPGAFISEQAFVQEPLPAYIPQRRGLPWHGKIRRDVL